MDPLKKAQREHARQEARDQSIADFLGAIAKTWGISLPKTESTQSIGGSSNMDPEKKVRRDALRKEARDILITNSLTALTGLFLSMDGIEKLRGPQGIQGIRGEDGQTGFDGEDGKDGKDFTWDMMTAAMKEEIRGPEGLPGTPGQPGRNGMSFTWEMLTEEQKLSLRGNTGPMGATPRHEWEGTKLRFETKAGVWGEWTDLKGTPGESNQWEFNPQTGGVRYFGQLGDVEDLRDKAGKALRVNSTSSGIEYYTPEGGAAWGGITGTLADQTDLQTALDGKYSTSNPAGYITSSDLSPYLTIADATVTYQPLGTYVTGATDTTLTLTASTLGINLAKANNWSAIQNFAAVTGLGTTSPNARILHIVNPGPTYTTITGSISSITQSVNDCIINGSGTAFLSELKVGDVFVHPSNAILNVVITRVQSNTLANGIGAFLTGYTGAGFRVAKRAEALEDASGNVARTTTTGIISPFTSTTILPFNYFKGETFFGNEVLSQHGLYIRSAASDGRMYLGHSNSAANLLFAHGNGNIIATNITISGASAWDSPLYLGMPNYGSNQTGIYIDRSGTGANQSVTFQTRRYAVNNDAPELLFSANGIHFGRRDGSVWNEGIDQITLSMDKTTGYWQIGDLGTTTPTGAAAWLQVTGVTEQFRLRYNATNFLSVTLDANANAVFDLTAASGSPAFNFSDPVLLKLLVEANAAGSGSPNIITASESNTVFTNEGATALNYHTLPTAVAGLTYTFYVSDSDGIRITANTGDIIKINGVASATAGYAECLAIGGSITLTAINATDWVATSVIGTWTLA